MMLSSYCKSNRTSKIVGAIESTEEIMEISQDGSGFLG
jgi:hypothetical protein